MSGTTANIMGSEAWALDPSNLPGGNFIQAKILTQGTNNPFSSPLLFKPTKQEVIVNALTLTSAVATAGL